MNKALVSIGSNENREANVDLCRHLLDAQFENVLYSKTSVTLPYGGNYQNDFLNQLALINTDKSESEIHLFLKKIEQDLGRDRADKETGKVVIDVDLVIWNDKVLKPEDLRRKYVVDLLESF